MYVEEQVQQLPKNQNFIPALSANIIKSVDKSLEFGNAKNVDTSSQVVFGNPSPELLILIVELFEEEWKVQLQLI